VPENVPGDTYRWTVVAHGEGVSAEFPLEVTVAAKLPPRLSLLVDLPTLRGAATTTFRYDATLKNEGDEETTVNLQASAPEGFLVSFRYMGQEVTSLPVGANESKRISIEARPYAQIPAGTYPIEVAALGGESEARVSLVAEVTGQPDLTITTPDERLSTQVYTGRETPVRLVVQNNGSAPALNVELSASAPSGWSVRFEPDRIQEIPVGQQVEITMHVKPADKAVAGDYMLTVRARPQDSGYESADFRITVLTSTLWGVVGILLIAVAVAVVGWAVMRFGRR
jgi:Predicted membrane protein